MLFIIFANRSTGMEEYIAIFKNSFTGYYHYLIGELSTPSWTNYFYWLIGASFLVWLLEILYPWRQKQAIFRKDFWLDGFYIIFNFFMFSLIGYNALSNIGVQLFEDLLEIIGIENIVTWNLQNLPPWLQLVIMFVIADFIHWNVHRQLHKRAWLWNFHKVHHSVKEMGFAAQFRFHFMETVIYKSLQYIPLAMIGFGIQEFFIVHMLNIIIGHLNHANINWGYGLFGYIFNNPRMHIWHHAKEFPDSHPYGMNFGISLSFWDYIFKTAYIPEDGKNIVLGFKGDDYFPEDFKGQMLIPFQAEPKIMNLKKQDKNEHKTV